MINLPKPEERAKGWTKKSTDGLIIILACIAMNYGNYLVGAAMRQCGIEWRIVIYAGMISFLGSLIGASMVLDLINKVLNRK